MIKAIYTEQNADGIPTPTHDSDLKLFDRVGRRVNAEVRNWIRENCARIFDKWTFGHGRHDRGQYSQRGRRTQHQQTAPRRPPRSVIRQRPVVHPAALSDSAPVAHPAPLLDSAPSPTPLRYQTALRRPPRSVIRQRPVAHPGPLSDSAPSPTPLRYQTAPRRPPRSVIRQRPVAHPSPLSDSAPSPTPLCYQTAPRRPPRSIIRQRPVAHPAPLSDSAPSPTPLRYQTAPRRPPRSVIRQRPVAHPAPLSDSAPSPTPLRYQTAPRRPPRSVIRERPVARPVAHPAALSQTQSVAGRLKFHDSSTLSIICSQHVFYGCYRHPITHATCFILFYSACQLELARILMLENVNKLRHLKACLHFWASKRFLTQFCPPYESNQPAHVVRAPIASQWVAWAEHF